MSAISEDDAPTSDNPSKKDAGIQNYTANEVPASLLQNNDTQEDTHCCGKCRLVFTSLDSYIQHKLSVDNCKVTYTKGNRWLIPRIVIKTEKNRAVKNDNHESSKPSPRKKGRRQSRTEAAHSQDDIIVKSDYTCKTCGKVFHREAILRRHVYYTHNTNFDKLDDDDNEEESVDTPEEPPLPADVGRGRKRRITEKDIAELYDGGDTEYHKKPHPCTQCNRLFRDHNILRAHMLTHSNQRDFPCKWGNCQYAFKTKGSLKRHMRRHTGERPYRCELCGRSFGESGALTRHLKARVACTAKTDAELPRYGKKTELDPLPIQKGINGNDLTEEQMALVAANETVDEEGVQLMILSIPEEGDFCVDVRDTCAMVVETSGVDGEPGEEEVVGENLETSSAFVCMVCKEGYEGSEDLIKHLKMHLVDAPFRCGLCTHATVSRTQLDSHMQLTHNTRLMTQATASDDGSTAENEVVTHFDSQQEAPPAESAQSGPILDQTTQSGPTVEQTAQPLLVVEQTAQPLLAVEQTAQPLLVVEQTAQPLLVVEQTAQPLLVVEQTAQPLLVVEQTAQPLLVVEQTAQPLLVVEQTAQPHLVVEQTAQPHLVVEQTAQPHLVVEQTAQPLLVVEQTAQPLLVVEQTAQPLMVVEQTAQPLLAVEQTAQPLLVVEQTAQPLLVVEQAAQPLLVVEQIAQSGSNVDPESYSASCQPVPVARPVMTDTERKTSEATLALQQLIALRGPDENVSASQPGILGYKALHKCPVCTRSFRGSTYLRLHLRTHTGERPHRCSMCGKTFTTKDTLNKHLTVHSTERQYKCGECGKLFKRISHVREHLKVHSNDRPYVCNMCNKTFKTVNACKVHTRTHTDSMPYTCSVCPKVFRERGSLERHVRTHTGEKPYQCTYCGRSFAEHGTLSRHLKAKAPCSGSIQSAQQPPEGDVHLATIEEAIRQQQQQQQKNTILTEFSSVVTDTQQYIIHTDNMGNVVQAPEEFVMVDSNGDSIQNVEVVTLGNVVSDMVTQNNTGEYVIVDNANISLYDPNTGQPITMENVTFVAPSGADEMMQTDGGDELVIIPDVNDDIVSLAMQDGSGDIRVVAVVPENQRVETVDNVEEFASEEYNDVIVLTQEEQIEHEELCE